MGFYNSRGDKIVPLPPTRTGWKSHLSFTWCVANHGAPSVRALWEPLTTSHSSLSFRRRQLHLLCAKLVTRTSGCRIRPRILGSVPASQKPDHSSRALWDWGVGTAPTGLVPGETSVLAQASRLRTSLIQGAWDGSFAFYHSRLLFLALLLECNNLLSLGSSGSKRRVGLGMKEETSPRISLQQWVQNTSIRELLAGTHSRKRPKCISQNVKDGCLAMVISWIIKNVYLNPGSPVVQTLRIRCWGYRFNPWLGKFHVPHYTAKKKKSLHVLLIFIF